MYQSPLDTIPMRDHEEDDVPLYITVFDRHGKIAGCDETCSCSVGMLDMTTLPKGGYITAIEVPLHFH